jgi:hypothetical protein
MTNASDPTKDPEFQKVVLGFLRTKLQSHKPATRKKAKRVARESSKPAR